MWTLRSRIIWHRSQKRRILRGRSAPTSRGVLEAYSSQKPQFATVRLSMWKGAPNNAEGKAKQCIGVMMSFCSILLRFLNRTRQNAEIRHSVWREWKYICLLKGNSSSKRMNYKVRDFGLLFTAHLCSILQGVLVSLNTFIWYRGTNAITWITKSVSSLLFRDQRGICESVTELPENWAKFFSWEEFRWILQHSNSWLMFHFNLYRITLKFSNLSK